MESGVASMLARLDERLSGIERELSEIKQQYQTKEGGIAVKDDVAELKSDRAKIIWFVILAVAGQILLQIFKN